MALDNRCPTCGALTLPQQAVCNRCFEPLHAETFAPATGETARLYAAAATHALMLMSSQLLEYTSPFVTLHTPWANISTIHHRANDDMLLLFQTPTVVALPLGSGQTWFSEQTRTIPLRQFGYPLNRNLSRDLAWYAPQLARLLR